MPTTPGKTSAPEATSSHARHNRAVGIRPDVLLFVVEVVVAGAVDPVELLGAGGVLEGMDAHPGRDGLAAGDHEQGSRPDQADEAEGVEDGHVVDAGPGEELGRAGVLGGAADVVLEALDRVLSAVGAGLFGGVGEELEA